VKNRLLSDVTLYRYTACVARWMRSKLTAAFNAWVAFTVNRTELRAQVVGRMIHRKLALAFRKWANEVWGTEYDRPPEEEGAASFEDRAARFAQLMSRWLRRRLFAAFNTWEDW
jgi:hypothetical protein